VAKQPATPVSIMLASPMRRWPYRVYAPVGAAAGGTNQASGKGRAVDVYPEVEKIMGLNPKDFPEE
jgi:hypothetical protein